MTSLEAVAGSRPSSRRLSVREAPAEYVIALDVADFTQHELTVEATGPLIAVTGESLESDDDLEPFSLRERLEELFRLPDDADPDRIRATYRRGTLEIHVRRRSLRRQGIPIERYFLVNSACTGS